MNQAAADPSTWIDDPDFLRPTLEDDGLILDLDQLLEGDDDDKNDDEPLRADLDRATATLHHAAHTLRRALETSELDDLRPIAALLDAPPAAPPDVADDDPPRLRALKLDLATARDHLLVLATRAADLLRGTGS
mmetsp:Transcript_3818/g.9800  ORF Transcript_3818/g.9800 Transcript_3818/m.9800 type:complete len:134 (+) Transcript_3818:3-404(+)